MKFRSDTAGSITGIWSFLGSGNTGLHVGNLWTSTGTKLATVTLSNETASGWRQGNFTSPVAITANTTYVVSYYTPVRHYANDETYFVISGTDHTPLHALSNGAASGNGVYLYASGGGFPSRTFNSCGYWVDVVFTSGP